MATKTDERECGCKLVVVDGVVDTSMTCEDHDWEGGELVESVPDECYDPSEQVETVTLTREEYEALTSKRESKPRSRARKAT